MEKIYPPNLWGSTEKFPLKTYFEEYNQLIKPNAELTVTESADLLKIKQLMVTDLDLDVLKDLSETCSPENLTCKGEDTTNFPMKLPEHTSSRYKLPHVYINSDKSKQLEVNKCKDELEKKRSMLELTFGNKRNYHSEIPFTMLDKPTDLEPGSDFIVNVIIFKPFEFNYVTFRNSSEKLRYNHEILVLGRNTLAELRDAIRCSTDVLLCKEVQSTNHDLSELTDAKKVYPSGCIFINDIFYNDFRSPDAIDYSAKIIDWAKDKSIGNFQSKSMDNVRLNELNPRLGYPYVYIHQGKCEHLLVFSDARLLLKTDSLHSENYPHVTMFSRMSNIRCNICSITYAKWILLECDRFPQEKCFLCTKCCNSYNYINGEKIGKFKLYPYYEQIITNDASK